MAFPSCVIQWTQTKSANKSPTSWSCQIQSASAHSSHAWGIFLFSLKPSLWLALHYSTCWMLHCGNSRKFLWQWVKIRCSRLLLKIQSCLTISVSFLQKCAEPPEAHICNTMPKSHPSTSGPWDLISEQIWTPVNGKRQIIFWSRLNCTANLKYVCWFKR